MTSGWSSLARQLAPLLATDLGSRGNANPEMVAGFERRILARLDKTEQNGSRMSLPPVSGSVLAKCGSTLLCYLRAAPLWLFVLVIFVGGALQQRLLGRGRPLQSKAGEPASDKKKR